MVCTQITELLKRERKDLSTEIERDKWFLSEREGHDVGWERAVRHFMDNYLGPWAEKFKEYYCRDVCHYACNRQN